MQFFKKQYYLLIGICLLLTSCNNKNSRSTPEIVNESITFSGTINDNRKDKEENPLDAQIFIMNPISGSRNIYPITVDKQGKFSIELPIEANPTIATINLAGEYTIFTYLIKGEKNLIEIGLYKKDSISAKLLNNMQLSSYDMTKAIDFLIEMEQTICDESSLLSKPFYNKSLEEYTRAVNENINCKIANALKKFTFSSGPIKEYMLREFRLKMLNSFMFFYSENILYNYRNTNPKELWDKYVAPANPSKSFYSFLKELNLNDPSNLSSAESYRFILNSILSTDTLGIQEINETPIDFWIKKTAETLSELVGFKEGFFYEQLAIRSYMRQFEYSTQPLTAQQKQNIQSYFKNKAIQEILFKQNEKIEKQAKYLSKPIVNQTPDLPNNKIFEAILSKYAGKYIMVDFWATWCGGCIKAIDEMKDLKNEWHDKDIVFVYITNSSSPKNRWEKRIQGIGGEHYYLSEKQWIHILEHFDFSGIPTYLLFDKSGILKKKITGYPGNNEMRDILTKLVEP